MKLDMGKAWSDAMALLSGNFGLVATIVGLFYFLPSFAFALLLPEVANPAPPPMPAGEDPDAVLEVTLAALQQQYAEGWPYLLVISLTAYIGAVAVLALFQERGNPTVGDALKTGFMGAPTYMATQILFGLAVGIVGGLLVGIAATISIYLAVPIGIIVLVAIIYASIKLVLVPAIIGMERNFNPITVMKRSWQLTKGNSLLIFLFLFILILIVGLISIVLTLVLTTIFAIFGEPVLSIGSGLVSSLISAVMGGLLLVVLAAIHRQLTHTSTAQLETFE